MPSPRKLAGTSTDDQQGGIDGIANEGSAVRCSPLLLAEPRERAVEKPQLPTRFLQGQVQRLRRVRAKPIVSMTHLRLDLLESLEDPPHLDGRQQIPLLQRVVD
jgi:hypothetical protein